MKRGNLLWTGSRMMLSEHRQLLNQRLKEKRTDEDLKRGIDEQQLREWQDLWLEAVETGSKVIITDGYNKNMEGHIIQWDIGQRIIYLQVSHDERIKVKIDTIMSFTLS